MESKVARQTSARLSLGNELRRLREGKGVSQQAVAHSIQLERDRISKLESGKTSLPVEKIGVILKFLDASPEETASILQLAEKAIKRQRSTRAEAARKRMAPIPPEYRRRIDMESEATAIWSYSAGILPLEIQTADYMRLLLTAGNGIFWPPSEDGISSRVQARIDRQNGILQALPPKALTLIFCEEALQCHPSTQEIMSGQMAYILSRAEELPNLTIRMIATADPRNPARDGALSVMEFAGTSRVAFAPVVYGASRYLRKQADTDVVMRVIERLAEVAYSPAETLKIIRQKLRDL